MNEELEFLKHAGIPPSNTVVSLEFSLKSHLKTAWFVKLLIFSILGKELAEQKVSEAR